MSDYLEIAKSMTPEDRAHMIAIADGCGHMLLQLHRLDTEAFAARYPGVITTRDGYRSHESGKYIAKTKWFSATATILGLQTARMIERFDMQVVWPENDEEAA